MTPLGFEKPPEGRGDSTDSKVFGRWWGETQETRNGLGESSKSVWSHLALLTLFPRAGIKKERIADLWQIKTDRERL
jgi:hypothetical protein